MEELKGLLEKLSPVFENAYRELKQTHIENLLQMTKDAVLKERDFIVIRSVSEEDCLARLSVAVDQKALEVIQQNFFLKAVPVGECNKLKRELKPIFKSRFLARKQDVMLDLKKAKLDELIYATQAAVLHQMDEIIRN